MAQSIVTPDLGFDTKQGKLANWLKAVGESVRPGEPIVEIEADKVTLEVVASVGGILLQQLAQVGDTLNTGALLALVGEPDEVTNAKLLAPREQRNQPESSEDTGMVPQPLPAFQSPPPAQVVNHPPPAADSLRATPVARRLAAENGLALDQIAGSGPAGMILKADVQARLGSATVMPVRVTPAPSPAVPVAVAITPVAASQPAPMLPEQPGAAPAATPTSPLRRAIAQRMSKSKSSIPHFYITKAINMDAALALRTQINASLPTGQTVTINDLVVKAVALVLREFPNLNATWEGEQIVQHPQIHVGMAVAVDGGLLTVVQPNADRTTISTLAAENKARIARARSGKVKPDDISGATFTISNLGAYDVEHFAPIINPPEAAILGVATAKPTAVVEDGTVVVRTQMLVTIAADHRLTDGVEAAQFLQRLQEKLENPLQVLI